MDRCPRFSLINLVCLVFVAVRCCSLAFAEDEATGRILSNLKDTLPKFEFEGTTYWVIEGDTRVTEHQLRDYAETRKEQLERYKAQKEKKAAREVSVMPRLLIQTTIDGELIRWTPGMTLKYCVLRDTFPTQAEFDDVATNMNQATQDWTETCNIHFEYVASDDGSTPAATPPSDVVFTVRKFPLTGGVIASSFFPRDGAQQRHLLVGPAYFTTNFNRTGVLRHELGHVIGFRHEHIRSEAPPACFTGELPDAQTLPLTEYNPTSVMHYFCGGVGDVNLRISSLDRVGSRIVYPFASVQDGLVSPVTVNIAELQNAAAWKFHDVKH
jgi:Dual-action HEIGH metallo-peptidase